MKIGDAGGALAGPPGPGGTSDTRLTWPELVLPERERRVLRDAVAELSRRRAAERSEAPDPTTAANTGITLLFAGGQGTGKTMTVRLIAADLGVGIVELDLLSLSAQERDDAHKLADRALERAQTSGAIVVFDRAEALLGAAASKSRLREPARTITMTDLVEKGHRYPGVVVFTSRVSPKLDPQLREGVDFVVEFPFPWSDARAQIWRKQLPGDARVSDEELEFLATSFKLPGAAIKACAEAAGRRAADEGGPVQLSHIAHALEHEYRGRLVTDQTGHALEALMTPGGLAKLTAEGAQAKRAETAGAKGKPAGAPAPKPPAPAPATGKVSPKPATSPPRKPAAAPAIRRTVPPATATIPAAESSPTPRKRFRGRVAALLRRSAADAPAVGGAAAAAASAAELGEATSAQSEPVRARIEAALGQTARAQSPPDAPPTAKPIPSPPPPAKPVPRPVAPIKTAAEAASVPVQPPPTPAKPPEKAPVERPGARPVEAAKPPAPPAKPVPVPARAEAARAPGARRARVSPAAAALALAGVLIAGALGFGIARATVQKSKPAPALGHASAGPVQITYPAGWHLLGPPSKSFGLADQVVVGPGSGEHGELVIGRTVTNGGSLLPPRLLVGSSVGPPAEVVSLGGVRFFKYPYISSGAAGIAGPVYAVPTSTGAVIAMCVTPPAHSGFTSTCERVLATLGLSSGSVLPLGQNAGYAAALNNAINKLNAVRAQAGTRLRQARDERAQANAASALAAAHASAASALAGLSAGSASAANSALVKALQTTAAAYTALARAAAANNARRYAAASSSVTSANAAVASALQQLSSLGYRVG